MTCLPEVHDSINPLSLQSGSLGHFIAKNNRRNATGFRLSSKIQLCSLTDSADHKGDRFCGFG